MFITTPLKKYSIGEVMKSQSGLKSGISVKFQFLYEGRKIDGSSWKGEYSANKGDRFIVEFAKDKIDLSKILLFYPIPDTLKIKIPEKGWSQIPN